MNKSDREWACSALTHCVREDTEATLLAMAEKDSFRALVLCLCDSEPLVVAAALGLAHACTVSGSPADQARVAETLVTAGVMAPLLRVCASASLQATDSTEDRPVKVQTLSRLLAVLCNMASLNDLALKTVLAPDVASDILHFAFAPLQNRQLHSSETLIYSVQFLAILTDFEGEQADESAALACSNFRRLFGQEQTLLLKATMANGTNPTLLRALTINVLLNVSLDSGLEADVLNVLTVAGPVITQIFDSFDPTEQLAALDELRANTNEQDQAAVKQLNNVTQLYKDGIDAQGLLLEIFSNLLVLGEEGADSEEFVEMEEAEDAAQLGAYMGRPVFAGASHFLVESGLAARLLTRCKYAERRPAADGSAAGDDEEYLSLQQRAVACLLNTISNPEFEQTTIEGASALWRESVDHIVAPAAARPASALNHDILTNILATLTQFLRILLQSAPEAPISFHLADVQGLIMVANSQESPDQARSSALAIIGLVVGGPWMTQLAEQDVQSLVASVLQLFVDALGGVSILLAAEAANALMDAFAEPTFNALTEASLVPAIKGFISVLKTRIAAERKTMSRVELDRLDETRVNLTRFLEYKRSQ